MHQPVLYDEIIHLLMPQKGGLYVDCTIGTGGHALGLLENSSPDGQLLGLDLDPQAIEHTRERLKAFETRVHLFHSTYTHLEDQIKGIGWKKVDGILLDLGLSSQQLDHPKRGFSFRFDSPLDMRFDPNNPVSAVDIVNTLTETELANIIYRFGEERHSRKVAKAIVQARPVDTTRKLADIVANSLPHRSKNKKNRKNGRTHPATRTFQAIRIAVNHELESIETVLPQAVESLKKGGRLAIISFHSLEDRIVKKHFKRESKDCICPPRLPVCTCQHKSVIRLITRRPIRPSEEEIADNPRSRSAKLRVVEKL